MMLEIFWDIIWSRIYFLKYLRVVLRSCAMWLKTAYSCSRYFSYIYTMSVVGLAMAPETCRVQPPFPPPSPQFYNLTWRMPFELCCSCHVSLCFLPAFWNHQRKCKVLDSADLGSWFPICNSKLGEFCFSSFFSWFSSAYFQPTLNSQRLVKWDPYFLSTPEAP